MAFKKFIESLNGDGVEGELVKGFIYSLISSVLVLAILYFITLKNVDNLIPKYGLYIFLSVLSIALISISVKHIRAYRHFPCMSGMMIGMTVGMVSGFLLGFLIGATNGMFWGSMFGMAVGILLGIMNGKCCGVMGIMEGIMAGFMGGLMGAMTAVMMINDNLKAAAIVVFVLCAVITIGLSYMIYKETREREESKKGEDGFVVVFSFILTAISILFMIFGPRSVLFK